MEEYKVEEHKRNREAQRIISMKLTRETGKNFTPEDIERFCDGKPLLVPNNDRLVDLTRLKKALEKAGASEHETAGRKTLTDQGYRFTVPTALVEDEFDDFPPAPAARKSVSSRKWLYTAAMVVIGAFVIASCARSAGAAGGWRWVDMISILIIAGVLILAAFIFLKGTTQIAFAAVVAILALGGTLWLTRPTIPRTTTQTAANKPATKPPEPPERVKGNSQLTYDVKNLFFRVGNLEGQMASRVVDIDNLKFDLENTKHAHVFPLEEKVRQVDAEVSRIKRSQTRRIQSVRARTAAWKSEPTVVHLTDKEKELMRQLRRKSR